MHHLDMFSEPLFWNRGKELGEIKRRLKRGGFGYVTGRRRIGKTATLVKACEVTGGVYHQAVEGTPEQQLLHLAEELRDVLPIFGDFTPKTWTEFFRLLKREKLPRLLVFDEFPYWVEGDPNLPSLFQKWVDHDLPKTKTLVLVSGSSQSMLYSEFLQSGAPLYGRASFHLHLEPMPYAWFCRTLKYPAKDPRSFVRFSLVGGVPHYWKLMPRGSVISQATQLYFMPSAILAEEPIHWIRDEGITGNLPKAILDLIGRGVHKPSELASRLGAAQGNLSRPLGLLLNLGLIDRELPYGESLRSTKKVLYRIRDAALSFYYGIFLPHRNHWDPLSQGEKGALLEQHASRQWEYFCRGLFPGSGRYWEKGVEIDLVGRLKGKRRPLVAECKWSWLGGREEKRLLDNLKTRFHETNLARKLAKPIFRVFSKKDLGRLIFPGRL